MHCVCFCPREFIACYGRYIVTPQDLWGLGSGLHSCHSRYYSMHALIIQWRLKKMPILLTFCLLLWHTYSAQNSASRIDQTLEGFYIHVHEHIASSPVPLFWRWNAREAKKVGPGIHCLRMRYKNLMNLIIKSSRDTNLRHITHKHSTVLFLLCTSVGQALAFIQCRNKESS